MVRFAIAATAVSLALAPAPIAAQETAAPAPEAEGAIGPAQLRDFDLEGTVIRRADPPPERSQPAPARQPAPSAPATAERREPAPPTSTSEPARQSAQRESSSPTRPAAQPESGGTQTVRSSILDFPPPTPATRTYNPAEPVPASSDIGPALAPPIADDSGLSPLPWIFAFLLLGGGAVYYFRRQRSGLAFAGAGASEFTASEPQPEPRPQPRPRPELQRSPAPTPPPPSAPVGIVSTRLRPTLDIRFAPTRLAVEDNRVTLEFDVVVVNSGSGPARDVLLEAAMFSAGPDQDREIESFQQRPRGEGERVPLIAPLNSMAFTSAVNLPRDRVRQFRAGDRTVFVPLIAFNLLYRSSGEEAQTSTSYLVGIDTRGEKLAPFRIDQGPRLFTDLAARELDVRLRK